jgi:hypothetical protein
MAHSLKKEDLLFYSYIILDESWPRTTKKLGLHEDAIHKPEIKLAKKNEYESGIIRLNHSTISKACYGKSFHFEGLEVKYEDFLEDTIIHESVHHIEDTFYDLGDDEYDCVSEGLADIVSLEIMLKKEKYNLVAWEVMDYFLEMKKEYKDYLGLPKIHNSLIEKVIEKGDYKIGKRSLSYAKGFFHICENYGKVNNYLGLLIEPFKDSETS